MSPILLASTLGRLLMIATQLAVGFLLTPDQYGEFAVAAALCNFLSLFQSGDLNRLALQDARSEQRASAELRSLLLSGCVLSAAGITALAALGGGKVNLWFAACLGVLPFLRVMANMRITLLSSRGASEKIAVVSSVEAVARSAVSISLALAGFGGWSLLLGEVCAVASSLVAVNRYCPGPGDAPPALRPEVLRSVGMVSLASLLNLVERELPIFAVGLAAGSNAAGSYAFASRIAVQMVIVTLPIITLEVIPRLLAARENANDFERTRKTEWRRVVLIGGALAFVLGVCAPLTMYALWGERWLGAVQTLPLLVLATAVRVAYLFNRAVLEARGGFRTIFLISIDDASLIVAAASLTLAHGGPVLLATGLLAEACVMVGLSRSAVRRTVGLKEPS